MKYISIASGSKGNCHLVQKKDSCILIDAGLSGKATIDAINMHDIDTSKIKAIFITHEIELGFPFTKLNMSSTLIIH